MTYEQDLQRLEEILEALDASDVPLDRALELFREGVERLRSASAALDRADGEVRTLLEHADGSIVVTTPDGG
ncbi:MAG TPA: exodeoxyribonuclease VII small subunit [Gemmatimonadaceae bacterium]|nr:exodeoxyribonuclease VII small subunit [Gemmatimonadaceae bacterium]